MYLREIKLIHQWKALVKDTRASTFLLLLLVGDCTFIFLHFLLLISWLSNPLLSLTVDFSYPEIYQYLKEIWIIILLLFILIKTRVVGYCIWLLLFLYLLFDDALLIHERFGAYISTTQKFTPFLGLRAQDYGELTVSVTVAATLLPLLYLSYVHGLSAFRQVTRHLLLLLLALVFFGIFVDMLVIIVKEPWIEYFLGVLEDGGEMIVMSFIVWYVFLVKVCDGNIGSTLVQ